MREDVAYAAGSTRLPSKDRGAAFRAGDTLVLRLRVHVFDCAEVHGLFDALAVARKDVDGANGASPRAAVLGGVRRRTRRASAGASSRSSGDLLVGARGHRVAERLVRRPRDDAAAARVRRAALARARARTLDFLFKSAQAPSGFFRSRWDGARWLDDGPTPARGAPSDAGRRATAAAPRGALAPRAPQRRRADLRRQALVVLQRLESSAQKPDARWLAGLGRVADAFVRLWDREKQLGQYVDVETGELIVGGSTSAGLAPAGLALAAGLLKRDDCLATAHAAGEHFYERWVRAGLTCGGPGDALQCPDGESAAALLESFVTLFEQTGDKVWLERATAAARLLVELGHLVRLPRSRARRPTCARPGAVFSNAQNRRGAPGHTLFSGDALLRLHRATGDVCVPRPPAGHSPQPRAVPAARGARRRGARPRPARERRGGRAPTRATGSKARPTSCRRRASSTRQSLLSYAEVPGVYVRTDTGFVYVFDHVEARVRERVPGRLVVSLKNPTAIDAVVRVLGEGEDEAARPLGPGALLAARAVAVTGGRRGRRRLRGAGGGPSVTRPRRALV